MTIQTLPAASGNQRRAVLQASNDDWPATFRHVLLERLGAAPEKIVPGTPATFKVRLGRRYEMATAILFANQQAGYYESKLHPEEGAWFAGQDANIQSSEADTREGRRLYREYLQSELRERWANCRLLRHTDLMAGLLSQHKLVGAELPEMRYRQSEDYEKVAKIPLRPIAPVMDAEGHLRAFASIYADEHRIQAQIEQGQWGSNALELGTCSMVLFGLQHEHLGVAEGVEAALAARAMTGVPTVAVRDMANMMRWQCPLHVKRVTIFSFAARANVTAAHALKARLETEGRRCDIQTMERPAPPFRPLRNTWRVAPLQVADEQ